MLPEYPNSANQDHPYILLLDSLPEVGALDGFFQIAHDRRTINGRLFSTPSGLIAALVRLSDSLKPFLNGNAGAQPCQAAACVIDRRLTGSVYNATTLRDLALVAVLSNRPSTLTYVIDIDKAQKTTDKVMQRIHPALRASPSLLRYQDPVYMLDRYSSSWRTPMGPVIDGFSAQMHELEHQYRANPEVPSWLKENVHSLTRYIDGAFDAVLPGFKEKLCCKFRRQRSLPTGGIMDMGLGRLINRTFTPSLCAAIKRHCMTVALRQMINFTDRPALERLVESEMENHIDTDTVLRGPHNNEMNLIWQSIWPRQVRQVSIQDNRIVPAGKSTVEPRELPFVIV